MKSMLFGLMLLSNSVFADDEAPFDIMDLPQGASVTLPSPATTLVPLETNYRVTPTDNAQVFRISAPPQAACAVKIQVFDKSSEEVKMATLKAGESLIYRFERFNGVRVRTTPINGISGTRCNQVTKLVLDSNHPLEIGM